MSLQTKVQLMKTLKMNTDVLATTDIKQQLSSLEKSTTKIEQRSISNRNKIRDLNNGLLNLDSYTNYSFNSIDTQISDLHKIVDRMTKGQKELCFALTICMCFSIVSLILSVFLLVR